MWRTVATVSLLANAVLAGFIVHASRASATTMIVGELVVPLLDFEFLRGGDAENTQTVKIEAAGGTHTCRLPSLDLMLESNKRRDDYGSEPAIVQVELLKRGSDAPRCVSFKLVREGRVHRPK